MNLKNLHTENKPVQTAVLFEPTQNVISIQIAKGEQLKEHLTKIPALLVCVSGSAVFSNEENLVINLQSGDYILIAPNVKHRVDAIEQSNFLLIK